MADLVFRCSFFSPARPDGRREFVLRWRDDGRDHAQHFFAVPDGVFARIRANGGAIDVVAG